MYIFSRAHRCFQSRSNSPINYIKLRYLRYPFLYAIQKSVFLEINPPISSDRCRAGHQNLDPKKDDYRGRRFVDGTWRWVSLDFIEANPVNGQVTHWKVKWPPTIGYKGHFESPGWVFLVFLDVCCVGSDKSQTFLWWQLFNQFDNWEGQSPKFDNWEGQSPSDLVSRNM